MNDDFFFKFGDVKYDLSSRTYVMGILNVTPDSFADGGKYIRLEDAVRHAGQMEAEGADFIDVGGQSTRPGSEEITVEEELNRVLPVIRELRRKLKVPISIDTYRSQVAEEALKEGAIIVNDISAFNFDREIPVVAAKYNATCIAMHIKGTPKSMQENPHYDNLVGEVLLYFENAVWKANVAGVDQLIIDPGIGFGKTVEHNLMLVKNIFEFKKLDCPIMIGVSNKSVIGKITGANVEERLGGTIALNTIAILNGVNILRVHDVKEAARAAKIIDEYRKVKS
jgi:dihydropteroate synthase